MSNPNEERTPARRTILSEFKTRLLGKPVDGGYKSPTLAFAINDKNRVTINIYSNIEGDRGNGHIKAQCGPEAVFMITALLRAAVTSKGPFRRTIKHEDRVFMGGKRSDNPMWIFDMIIERRAGDADVWIIIKSYKRPDLEFTFRPTDYHQLVDGQGQLLTVEQISDLYCHSYIDSLESLLGDLLVDYQVRLYGMPDQPTVEGRSANFILSSIANNPRVSVFTAVEQDQHNSKGLIAGKIDVHTCYSYIHMLKQSVTWEPGTRHGIKNFEPVDRNNGGPRGEKRHATTLVIGKDENGVIYTALVDTDKSRPNIRFPIELPRGFVVLDENEQPLAPSRSSALMAISYAPLCSIAVARHLNKNYTPPDPSTWQNKQGGGQQRQGGYNNNQRQGGGGGYNNNNRQQSGGSNNSYQQRQAPTQTESFGGNPNSEVSQPNVITRDNTPPSFDTQIPF